VIILKPGKPSYSTPKVFQPIVLLNTLGKLVKKMLARRLQFDGIAHDVFHPNQFGGIAQRSTEDAGVYLTHLVCAGWAKGLVMSDVKCLAPVLKLLGRSVIGRWVDLMSYVDDGTFIVSSWKVEDNLPLLKEAYGFVHNAFSSLGLILEHNKSKVFHFSHVQRFSNPAIDLGFAPYDEATPLKPKPIWRYLGFFFDRKLLFQEHV
jgi:hypothetical protein